MGIGSSYKIVVDLTVLGQQNNDRCSVDWIAKPPREGEARVPPLFEKELVAGDGPILGKGAFGVTRLSKSALTGEYYAIKVLAKAPIVEKKSLVIVQAEVDTLARMQHPFIIHLFAVHQDDVRVALVMEYAAGGELLHRIRKRRRLPDAEAKFYAAEIADALQYMHHEVGIIYHDLKPENILLAADGHVKVVDFGLALDADARQWDACRMGTSMYMAPELAKHRVQGGHSTAVDWWSFGCVVYEMLSGSLPFGDSADLTKYEIYTNIINKKLRFGKGFGSRSKGLLRRLLDKNPETRIGWMEVQEHGWFRNVDWAALRNKRIFPPWVPPSMKPGCTECFLQWEAEPPAGAPARLKGVETAADGDREHSRPPDQGLECCRIKVPPGCGLRPPPRPSQQSTPGRTRGNGSKEMSGAKGKFQRLIIEGMSEMKGKVNSAQERTGSTASRGSASLEQLPPLSKELRSIEEAGKRRYRDPSNIGLPGGGNAKRRFKTAAGRVAAVNCLGNRQQPPDARLPTASPGTIHRPTPNDAAARHHRHTGTMGDSNAPVVTHSSSKTKPPLRAVGYR